MLRVIAPDVWTATHKLRFYGAPIVTRMTVLRLADGGLLLHGPVPRTPEMELAVGKLGTVRWVVAPNRFHHLWAGDWAQLSGVKLLGAPGLAKKRPDLRFDSELGSSAPEDWADRIDQELVGGLSIMGEVAFNHRASRTLIVADLLFNYRPTRSLPTKLIRLIEGCDGKFVMPRLIAMLIRDRHAFARSVDRILSWDFDRIIVAHGDIVDSGGHAMAERELRRRAK